MLASPSGDWSSRVHSCVLRLASCVLRLASCLWWLNGSQPGSRGAFYPAPAGGDYCLDRLGHSVGWLDDGGTMGIGKWTTHEYLTE